MARAPEKDSLRKECPRINSALASLADLNQLGAYLSSHNFLTKPAVAAILDLNDSKLTKASKLMMAVDTSITISRDQKTITDQFNTFLLMLYNDLGLTGVAQQLARTNESISAECHIKYTSPLPTRYSATSVTTTGSSVPQSNPTSKSDAQPHSGEDDGELTLADILAEVGIEETALEDRVTENGLHKIANLISPKEWGTYASALRISDNVLSGIKEDVKWTEEQRYEGLLEWKRNEAFRAKYLKLVKLFLENGNAELAENVCKLVRDKKRK